MSEKGIEKVNSMRNRFREVGAQELTQDEGILLRTDLRGEYLKEDSFIMMCVERRVFVWNLRPKKKQ